MYKTLFSACLISSVGGAVFAAELTGADIVTALSGHSYACQNQDKSKQMDMDFPDLNPATQEIPYTYVYEGKKQAGAYVFKNKGKKMVSKGSGQKRRVVQTSATSVQIIGRSGQYWICTES